MKDCMKDEIRAEIEGMGWEPFFRSNRWMAKGIYGEVAFVHEDGECGAGVSTIDYDMSSSAPLRLFILLAKANGIEVTL
jgi:hypothetical protein